VCASGVTQTTVQIVKAEYKLFGELTLEEVQNEGLPQFDSHGNAISLDKKRILLRRIISLFSGENISRQCTSLDISLMHNEASLTLAHTRPGKWISDQWYVFVITFEKYGRQAQDAELLRPS
jgi:hypothetical protein